MLFGIFEPIVEIVAREHDPPADCVLAGVVELNRLEELVGLAFTPSLRAPAQDMSGFD